MARDFIHERLIEKPARKQERNNRNKARRAMAAKVGAAAVAGKQVDHADGSALNNKISNLRLASAKANNTGRSGKPARIKKR